MPESSAARELEQVARANSQTQASVLEIPGRLGGNLHAMRSHGWHAPVGSWLELLLSDESGQSVTEYAVVMGVITLVAVASISAAGAQTLDVLRRVASNLH